jgi:hypothetical protein
MFGKRRYEWRVLVKVDGYLNEFYVKAPDRHKAKARALREARIQFPGAKSFLAETAVNLKFERL